LVSRRVLLIEAQKPSRCPPVLALPLKTTRAIDGAHSIRHTHKGSDATEVERRSDADHSSTTRKA
jgi:hypothetical protein